jgi:hypothetical protein
MLKQQLNVTAIRIASQGCRIGWHKLSGTGVQSVTPDCEYLKN